MGSDEEEPVAWLRQRIRERLYLAQRTIELGNARRVDGTVQRCPDDRSSRT